MISTSSSVATFALTIAALPLLLFGSPARASDSGLHTVIAIRSKMSYDSNGGKNIDYSHIEVLVNNAKKSFQEFVDHIEDQPEGTSMWEISLRVSAVPSILRDSVGTQVLSQVRELIDTKFAEVKNTTEAKIDAAESDAYAKLAAGRAQALGQVDAITQAKLSEIAASNPALAQAIQYQNQSPTAKAAVDQVTGQIRAGVLQKIDEEVGKNRTIIEQTIAGVRQGAKTQLQDAYRTVLAEQTRRIDKRLNDIERDTTVQELALKFASKVDANRAVYLQVGKITPELGLSSGAEHRSYIENLRPGRDLPTALSGPHDALGLNMGMIQNITFGDGQKMKVKVDTFIYRDRTSFVDGNDYVASLLSLSDKDYNHQSRFGGPDSGMLRIMAETEKISAFMSGAFHTDGKLQSLAAGMEWKITPLTRFTVNGYTGNRVQASDAVSVYLSRELNDTFTVYGGYVYARGRNNSLVSAVKYDSQEWLVGASANLPEIHLIGSLTNTTLHAEAYVEKRSFDGPNPHADGSAYGIRIGLATSFGILSKEEKLASLQKRRTKLVEEIAFLRSKQKTQKLNEKVSASIDATCRSDADELAKNDTQIEQFTLEITARNNRRMDRNAKAQTVSNAKS